MVLHWGNLTADEQREQNAKVSEKFKKLIAAEEKPDLLIIVRHVRESLTEIFTREYDERVLPPMVPLRENLDSLTAPDPCPYSALLRSTWGRIEVFAVWRTLKIANRRAVALAVNKLVDLVILKFYTVERVIPRLANTEAVSRKKAFKAARMKTAAEALGERLTVTAAANLKYYKKGALLTVETLEVLDECWRLAVSRGYAQDFIFKVQTKTRTGRLASVACSVLGAFAERGRKMITKSSDPLGLSLDEVIRARTGKTIRGKAREEYRAMADLLCALHLLRSEGTTRSRKLYLGDGPHRRLARVPSERRDTMNFGPIELPTGDAIFEKLSRLIS